MKLKKEQIVKKQKLWKKPGRTMLLSNRAVCGSKSGELLKSKKLADYELA